MKIMSKLKTDNDLNNSLKDLIDYYNYYEIIKNSNENTQNKRKKNKDFALNESRRMFNSEQM